MEELEMQTVLIYFTNRQIWIYDQKFRSSIHMRSFQANSPNGLVHAMFPWSTERKKTD